MEHLIYKIEVFENFNWKCIQSFFTYELAEQWYNLYSINYPDKYFRLIKILNITNTK